MQANIVGLIELENGLCADLHGSETTDFDRSDAELGQSLSRQGEMANQEKITILPPKAPRPKYLAFQTRFIRANLEQLNCELQEEFQELLVRLFESNE